MASDGSTAIKRHRSTCAYHPRAVAVGTDARLWPLCVACCDERGVTYEKRARDLDPTKTQGWSENGSTAAADR